jgi:hypothetical protein
VIAENRTTMPSVIGALWRRRSRAVLLAGLLWCAGAAVTVANLAGLRGRARRTVPSRQRHWPHHGADGAAARRTQDHCRDAATGGHQSGFERRPPFRALAVAGSLGNGKVAGRSRCRVGDVRAATWPDPVAAADASTAVLSDISGTTVSERELRRWRLALLLGLPLCGGLVLSLATALMARR